MSWRGWRIWLLRRWADHRLTGARHGCLTHTPAQGRVRRLSVAAVTLQWTSADEVGRRGVRAGCRAAADRGPGPGRAFRSDARPGVGLDGGGHGHGPERTP